MAGHAGAEYQLGRMYELGIGAKMDPDIAMRLYRLAAQHGNAEATEKLAELNRFIDQVAPEAPSKQKRNGWALEFQTAVFAIIFRLISGRKS